MSDTQTMDDFADETQLAPQERIQDLIADKPIVLPVKLILQEPVQNRDVEPIVDVPETQTTGEFAEKTHLTLRLKRGSPELHHE